MAHPTNTASPKKSSKESKANLVYKYMKDLDITPKDFILEFLTSSGYHMPEGRQYWASQRGWPSTSAVLDTIRETLRSSTAGQLNWYNWMFAEVTNHLKPFRSLTCFV